MESLESELRRVHIEVLEDTTEEEVLERFRRAKADILERRRQRILWDAASIMLGYQKKSGSHTTPPSLQELRRRLESLRPKIIQGYIRELKAELRDYENFEKELFEPRLWEQIPVNWEYMAATKEEYVVAILKERNSGDLETVKAAVPYLRAIIGLHKRILREKVSFLKQHEPEVLGLVQECTKLTKEAGAIKREVTELVRKLERTSLSDKDKTKLVEKILTLIRKHQQLEAQHGPVHEKLALYTVDKPEIISSLPGFESSRYNLPLWLQVKLERGK